MRQWKQSREAACVITAPAAVTSGTATMHGPTGRKVFGIYVADAASGAPVGVQMEGVVELPKVSASVFVFGQEVFFDDTTKDVGVSAAGKFPIGSCVSPGGAGSGVLTCLVKLYGHVVDDV